MTSILVTGGAGMIGSHLVDALIQDGHEVVIIDNLSTGQLENVNPKATFINKSITEDLSEIFKRHNFEYVFHLAAQINLRTSFEKPAFDANTNIVGSLKLIELCLKYKVKKFIFSSSGGAVYSPDAELPCKESSLVDPQSPYGLAKLTIENYLRLYNNLHGLDYTCLRFSNVYGPRQSARGEAGIIAIFLDKAIKNEVATIYGTGYQTRDFIFVEDVCNICTLALNNHVSRVINVSTQIETSVNDIADFFIKELNLKVKYAEAIPGELQRSCLCNDLAKNDLKWEPKYNLSSGLAKTIDFYKKNDK